MTPSRPRFGTDGVRGLANTEITPEYALALGGATAVALGASRVLVGRDTRRSGTMLSAAVLSGAASVGAEGVDLGVLPTPAVAMAALRHEAAAVMVSASHNPFADNGLKVFGPGGRKLTDAEQDAVEKGVGEWLEGRPVVRPSGAGVGVIVTGGSAAGEYVDALVSLSGGEGALAGLKVVVDTSHGAASGVSAELCERLGIEAAVVADAPDGLNINAGVGSTHLEHLQAEVSRRPGWMGLALDGDADRCLAVDESGQVIDGDRIIAICAGHLHDRGSLTGDAIAVTVMSNLGLHRAMAARGIRVVETAVGDRHVLDALESGGLVLGGEQSGHVIFRDVASTGDGLLTGLRLLEAVRSSGRSLSELATQSMTQVPQVLTSVRLSHPPDDLSERLAALGREAGADLGASGRVLLRPSGTEPVVRVMVEAEDSVEADRLARHLAEIIGNWVAG